MASNPDSKTTFGPQNQPPKSPRKRGRWLRVTAVVLGLVVVLVAAAPTLVGGLLRGRIEAAAGEALESDVSIGRLSLGWLSGLEVGDVDVKPQVVGKPGFSIGSITAKPELAALLKGRVEVPDLVVKHVTVNLSKGLEKPEEEEEEDEEAEDESKPPASVPDFGVRATVEDVTVVYHAPGWARPVRIDHLGPMTISATSRESTRVELKGYPGLVARVDVLWARDGKRLRRRERLVTGEVRFDRVDLKSFEPALGPWVDGLRGFADGTVTFRTAGKGVASSGKLAISGAAVALTGAPEEHVLQELAIQHDVQRDESGTAWSGKIEVGAGKALIAPVSSLGRPLAIDRLDLVALLAGNVRVDVERLAVQAGFGSISASGRYATGREPSAASAQIEARAAIDRLAQWVGGMPDVTGALASSAKVVLEPGGLLTVRGATTLKDFGAKALRGVGAINEREIVLKHDLDWGADVLRMHDVGLTSSFATLKCTGALQPREDGGPPEGQVDLQATADLDTIAALLGENLATKPGGRLSARAKVSGTREGTSFDATLNGEKLVLSGGAVAAAPLDLGSVQGSARGRLGASRSRLDVPEWVLRSRVFVLGGSLEAGELQAPHPHVALGFTGSLEPDLVLPSFTPEPRKAKVGAIHFNGSVKGTDTGWRLSVDKLTAAGLTCEATCTVPHDDVPAGAPQFTAKVAGPLDRVAPLVSAEMTAAGRIRADLSGSLGVRPTVDANVQCENLQLQAARGGSTMSGNALIDAKLDASRTFEARLVSPRLTFAGADGRTIAGEVSAVAQGAWDGETGVLDLKSLSVNGPGAVLTGTARVQPGTEAVFDVKSDLVMAEAAPVLAFFAPSLEASGKGALAAKGVWSLRPEGPAARASRADLDFRVDALKTEALDLRNVELQAVLDGGVASTKRARADLNGGTAALDASVDFRPDVPEWKCNTRLDRVQITKEMQPAIARAIPIFAGLAVTVTGVVHSTIDVAGRGEDWEAAKPTLTGNGLIGGANTKVAQGEIMEVIGRFVGLPREVAFEDFETKFRIENGVVRQDRLVLSSAQVDLRMSGTTSLDGRLHYDLGVRPKGSAAGKWQKKLLDREGFLAMRLAGDVRKPSIKPPKMEDVLGGQVEDLLKGGLEDLLRKKKKN
jgi:hypothetical protein